MGSTHPGSAVSLCGASHPWLPATCALPSGHDGDHRDSRSPESEAKERASMADNTRGFIRAMHPYAFKSGEWGQIVGERERDGRRVWMVVWPDGETDEWPATDPEAGYEFKETDD